MASKVRIASVKNKDIDNLIIAGAQLKTDIDAKTSELKQVSTKLSQFMKPHLNDGESSVKIATEEASAMYTHQLTYKIATKKQDEIDKIEESLPILNGAVTATTSYEIDPISLKDVLETLEKAGLKDVVKKKIAFKVDGVKYRTFAEEAQTASEKDTVELLEKTINITEKDVVKYEL